MSEQVLPLTGNIDQDAHQITENFHQTDDLVSQKVTIDEDQLVLLYFEGAVDAEKLERLILEPLRELWSDQAHLGLALAGFASQTHIKHCVKKLTEGYTLLLIEGQPQAYAIQIDSVPQRTLTEPASEQVIRGSHDGFNERLDTNIALLRRRLKNEKLVIRYLRLGKQSQTKYAIIYMHGIANSELVDAVTKRVQAIHQDNAENPGGLVEWVEDHPYSPFPQLFTTERPDVIASDLVEGRVVIMSDNSPTAITAPGSFFAFYQTPEDYNTRWMLGTFFRLIRYIGLFVSICLPAFYISVITFHYEVIPIDLVFTVKASLENVPYPPIIEAMAMLLVLELLREASVRLPARIAQTIGVVGGLVIGTAIVEANFISNTMVIVIAITAIASFTAPNSEMGSSIRVLGFPMMLLAYWFGFIGMIFGMLYLIIHLSKMTSLGRPFTTPIAPIVLKDWKDTFYRLPMWRQRVRPDEALPDDNTESKGGV